MGKKLLSILLSVLLIVTITGCNKKKGENSSTTSASSQQEDPEFPLEVNGSRISEKPLRVVSLSPSLTQIMVDMGYGERLTGVSDFCEAVGAAISCGTVQLPDFDAIRAVKPDLVVAQTNFAEQDLKKLQQMGAAVVILPHADRLEGLLELYRNLAMTLDGETTGGKIGEEFYSSFKSRLDEIADAVAGEEKQTGAYLRMLDYTVATGDTFEGDLLEAIGIENIAQKYGEWTFPKDYVGEYTPDVIFYDRSIEEKTLTGSEAYKGLSAIKNKRYLAVDSTVFERQGLDMISLLQEMAQFAYPEASFGSSANTDRSEPSSTVEESAAA